MKNLSFQKRLKFAAHGVASAWRTEASFRTQVLSAFAGASVFAWLGASAVWWAVFILISGAVLAAELFNTALEHLVDRLHPELHPTIKLAKDCAAGAVLILSFAAIAILAAFLISRVQVS